METMKNNIRLYTQIQLKQVLTTFDDKRFHLSDGVTTFPLGWENIGDYYIEEYPQYKEEIEEHLRHIHLRKTQ